ncbi:restriction endonuclease subunit S [Kaistella sp. PBT33-4]|nr:restriction endonuclease subunit S [Kaistella sp. PBT33-4]
MKQTEIGWIPEDWEVVTLQQISKITRLAGYEYSTYWKEQINGEIIGLRGFNIGKNRIIHREFSYISDKLSKKLIRSRLFCNDIIYPCVGTIGNAAVITENDRYHIQQNIAKITPQILSVYPFYLSHYLMSDFGLREVEKFNGSSSQPNVLVGSLRQYNIILPPLPEQEAIAGALSDADAWIESLEQLMAKKRLIKQGAMQTLLTPKDDWEVKKLGDRSIIYTGKKNNQDKSENGKYPFFVRSQTVEKINSYSFNGEAILIPGEGNLGSIVHYINGKFDFHQRVYKISDFVGLNGKYLYFYFRMYFGNHAMQNTVKATVDSIRLPTLEEFIIKFPSLSEQERIATILSDMDAEIETLEQKLIKAKQIKQGLMQELLTGRIRLV